MPDKIFINLQNIKLDKTLHESTLPIRNSIEHFEERIKSFETKLDHFSKVSYTDQNINWNLVLGKGGISFSGFKKSNNISDIIITNLIYSNWIREGKNLAPIDIKVIDIWNDVKAIYNLTLQNIIRKNKEVGYNGPPSIGAISIFGYPDK